MPLDNEGGRRLTDQRPQKPVTQERAVDPCSMGTVLLPTYQGLDLDAALDRALAGAPPGVAVAVTERPESAGGWFNISERRGRELDGQVADSDGRPVPRSGWRFPSLSDLRLK